MNHPERAHPQWPVRPGVEIGCNDRHCAACYEQGDISLWDNDLVQFARLLAEISATQDYLDIDALCQSMDLAPERINELFDRADAVFEHVKAQIE